MSSTIGSVSHLVTVIRSQLLARGSDTAPLRVARSNQLSKTSGQRSKSLEALIAQRCAEIAPDDPHRGNKAFRIFLESVLLSHFGDQLINDPRFYQMVDDVQSSMQSDPAVSDAIASATKHLLEALLK